LHRDDTGKPAVVGTLVQASLVTIYGEVVPVFSAVKPREQSIREMSSVRSSGRSDWPHVDIVTDRVPTPKSENPPYFIPAALAQGLAWGVPLHVLDDNVPPPADRESSGLAAVLGAARDQLIKWLRFP
jgi:hypothetical protein